MVLPNLKKATLPAGHYYMATMQIAESFGGLTAAMLERARVFSDVAGVQATVLTVEPRPSYRQIKARLVAEGRISENVQMLSFHEDIRSRDTVAGTPRLDPETASDGSWEFDEAGKPFSYTVMGRDLDLPERISYTKADGTVYLIERRKHDQDGNRTERHFTRFGATGSTEYKDAGAMYRKWFDEIRATGPSFLIVDSKYSALHFNWYENKDVLKFHIVHGYHVVGAGNPITGKLVAPRQGFLNNQDRWDGVVCLTNRNRTDLAARFGSTNNRFVISNIVPRLPIYPAWSKRSRTRGVMVARMSPVKNIPVALRIIQAVHERFPSVTLDIYGGGPDLEKMESLKHEMGLDGVVTLHGATPQAATQFDTAAFTLLTSKSEMQPLVIMEAMGRGCPPVALDIRYGPRDLIRSGATGFVVPVRETEQAVEKVLEILRKPLRARLMSKRAWKASSNFGTNAALSQWAQTILTAQKAKARQILMQTCRLRPASLTPGKLSLSIPLKLELSRGQESDLGYKLIWMDRKSGVQFTAQATRKQGKVLVPRAIPEAMNNCADIGPFDAYLEVSGMNYAHRFRVPVSAELPSLPIEGLEFYRTIHGNLTLQRV